MAKIDFGKYYTPEAPRGASQPETPETDTAKVDFSRYYTPEGDSDALAASLFSAAGTNPDEEAEKKRISKDTNTPAGILPGSINEAREFARAMRNNPELIKLQSPSVAKFLEKEDNAKIVGADGVDGLRDIERTYKVQTIDEQLKAKRNSFTPTNIQTFIKRYTDIGVSAAVAAQKVAQLKEQGYDLNEVLDGSAKGPKALDFRTYDAATAAGLRDDKTTKATVLKQAQEERTPGVSEVVDFARQVIPGAASAIAGAYRFGDTALPDSWLDFKAEEWLMAAERIQEYARATGAGELFTAAGASTGYSLANMMPSIFGGPAGWVTSAAMMYRSAYNEFSRDLRPHFEAENGPVSDAVWSKLQNTVSGQLQAYGAWEAGAETVSNFVFFKILTKTFGKKAVGNLMKRLTTAYLTNTSQELLSETFTQMGQTNALAEANARLGLSGGPDKRSWTSLADWFESTKEVAPVVMLQSAVMAGGGAVVRRSYDKVSDFLKGTTNELARANDVTAKVDQLQVLEGKAAASEVKARDAETFRAFIETMTEDAALETIYASKDAVRQALEADTETAALIQQNLPELIEQVNDPVTAGADVAIRVSDFLTHLSGTGVAKAMYPTMRVDPEGPTYTEAQEFYQTESTKFGEQLTQLAEETEPVLSREEFEEAKADQPQVENVDQLVAERDALPEGDPRRGELQAQIEQAQTQEQDAVAQADTYEEYLAQHKNKADVKRREKDELADTILGQFKRAARFSAPVNRAYAAPLIAAFEVNADRMGLKPMELYRRLPWRLQAFMHGVGRVLSQEQQVLTGAPEGTVPFGRARAAAAMYLEQHPEIATTPVTEYATVDSERAKRIAKAYEEMKHDPNNPEVRAAYDALIRETLAQYEAVLATGLVVEFIPEGAPDPYAASPRMAIDDVLINNHLWVFPTTEGFGSSGTKYEGNPLLQETQFKISGRTALANDIFRVVHDYFGHIKEGVGFRANGEENAWRLHSSMYSPLARRALTTETRGQNSWVNFGPFGEKNRSAKGNDTTYADQKTGLLPDWVTLEGSGQVELADFGSDKVGDILRKDGWAILTAFKEGQTAAKNKKAMAALRKELRAAGYFFADSRGKYGTEEPSFVVMGITQEKALELGRKYDQDSVLTREGYVYQDGSITPTTGVVAVVDINAGDNFTEIVLPDGTISKFSIGLDFDTRIQPGVERLVSPDRIEAQQTPVDNPNVLYQTNGKPGELTIRGVHFSTQRRPTLSGAFYGTGIKGAEAKRLAEAKDPRIKRRINFYVDEGKGVFPEGGVGRVKHEAVLTNMYDASTNPLKLKARNEAGEVDFNAFESAVLDAGFSGYYVRAGFGRQGVAVVLGNTPVTPELYQAAYHGSPHTFEAFDLSQVGSGEGLQAYGWGMYFAENRRVAEGYFKSLSVRPNLEYLKLGSLTLNEANSFDYTRRAGTSDLENVRATLAEDILIVEDELYNAADSVQAFVLTLLDEGIKQYREEWPEGAVAAERLRKELARKGAVQVRYNRREGGVYSVDVPDSVLSEMLLWDAPLSEQPEGVKRVLQEHELVHPELLKLEPGRVEGPTGRSLYERLSDSLGGQEAASKYLNSLGIRGLQYLDGASRSTGEGTRNYVIWDQALLDEMSAEVRRDLFQTATPTFYSQLARGLNSAKFESAPADQWKAWLAANAGKLGIKKDEIQWTGITDWLDLQTGKVSKVDIKAYLDSNGVQVTETVLGIGREQATEELNAAYEAFDRGEITREERNARVDAVGGRRETSYDKYTVPGGENYKELLLTLPAEADIAYKLRALNSALDLIRNGELPENLPADRRARFEEVLAEYEALRKKRDSTFNSPHFARSNVLAHVRFDERTDAEGNRVLFIQEVQSDWGQEGKKKGFKVDALTPDEQAELDKLSRLPMSGMTQQQVDELLYLQAKRKHEAGVPAAPFVTDTKAWVSLAVKRMLRYAAENGFDKVAFINGQQAADLYDLSKQVDEVFVSKTPDGRIRVIAEKAGRAVLNRDVQNGEELADLIGKDLAEKANVDDMRPGEKIAFSGEGLKVGGEGMLTFYDQIVPQVVKEVLKKVGGGRVDSVVIGVGDQATRDAFGEVVDVTPGGLSEQTGFTITPEMRESILAGLPLFQTSGQPLGSFNLDTMMTTILQGANLSTMIHESGHFYLKMLQELANMPEASQQQKDDYEKTLRWFGVTKDQWENFSLEELRPYHEQWAQSFERWNLEGKAPTQEMQPVFSRFRAFMLSVYKTLENFLQQNPLAGKLDDEIRGVFSRMIAAEEAIRRTEEARSYLPLFETAEQANTTPGVMEAYLQLGRAATQDAVDDMQTRSLRDMRWLTNARSRALKDLQALADTKRKEVRERVTKEVMSEPVNQARTFLRTGTLVTATGEEIETTVKEAHKLDKATVDSMYPEGALDRPDLTKLRGLTAAGGVDPELVAQMFGYASGDRLIREIIAAENAKDKIDGLVDQRMLEENGELIDQQSVERAADEAVHNAARARFMATGLKILSGGKGDVRLLVKAARQAAENAIASKRVRDIKPGQYRLAETRANKEAIKAAPTSPQKAIEAQRAALLNNSLAAAAQAAQTEVEKVLAYLAKFNREGTRKNLDIEYLEQIDALLEPFDLRKGLSLRTIDSRTSLTEWLAKQEDMGFQPVLDPEKIAEARQKSYKNMTMAELRELVDSIKEIEHLGRLKKKLLTAKDQREFDAVIAEVRESIRANANRSVKEKGTPSDVAGIVAYRTRQFVAAHRKFASFVRELDGGKDLGALYNTLVAPMFEAGQREVELRAVAAEEMARLFEPLLKEMNKTPANLYALRRIVPGTTISQTHEERIMFALNWGNEGNRQRAMDGGVAGHRAISAAEGQAIIDTLTKDEMDAVQSVWDFLESYRPLVAEQERALTGRTPEWVEPTPVVTRFGTYRGGYFPAKYDTLLSSKSETYEAAADLRLAMRGAFGASSTRNGYTKQRAAEVVGRPLLLSFNAISQHVQEVTHRLAWQDWLIDANRVLRELDPDIRGALGVEALQQMQQHVRDVATGDAMPTGVVDLALARIRTGTSIIGMGWRVITALLQPSGIAQTWARLGGGWTWSGVTSVLKNPAKTHAFIMENSKFMENRAKTMNREINEIMNRIRVGKKLSLVQQSYFLMITKMQLLVDMPTYMGAYEKALSDLGYAEAASTEQRADIERRAHVFAGQTVKDTQSSGGIEDLAGVQKGGQGQKLFTNFYSFFSALYNLNVENFRTKKLTDPLQFADFVATALLLNVMPAVYAVALRELLKGECGGDLECLAQKYKSEQLSMLFGQMVGVREIGAGVDVALGGPSYGFSGVAGLRFFAEAYKAMEQTGQGEADFPAFKAYNNAAGILFHYPAGQINTTVEGMLAIQNGEVEGVGAVQALVAGPPKD